MEQRRKEFLPVGWNPTGLSTVVLPFSLHKEIIEQKNCWYRLQKVRESREGRRQTGTSGWKSSRKGISWHGYEMAKREQKELDDTTSAYSAEYIG